MSEAVHLSGISNPKSVSQLREWLEAETGEDIENLQKETVKDLLKSTDDSIVRRMLEIRQELGKTSVSKYSAMDDAVCGDGRIRGLLQFYGANRTGRWAGRLVQAQNLPRNYIQTLELARRYAKEKNVPALELLYGNIPDTLSQLIRTAFVPDENSMFIVSDFSAIEARVIAWLAGEQWRQDVFATHGKIYEASASAMFGVPIDEVDKELRQKGKVAELALGYQGASGALIQMGALKMGLTEAELPDIVRRWREANKRIVDLWYAVERAASECVRSSQPTGVRGLIFAMEGDFATNQEFLTIKLPSGRKLYYVTPFLSLNQWGNDSIRYWGVDQKTRKWTVQETYGGRLVENIVQAIARDCLALAMRRLEAKGYEIVFHVHDEVIIERRIETDPKTEIQAVNTIMAEPIPWAPGLILKAEGFATEFYKKD